MTNPALLPIPKQTTKDRLSNFWKRLLFSNRVVHFVYLVPSDKTDNAAWAIHLTALHLQAWYRWQMQNGKTFSIYKQTPGGVSILTQIYRTSHSSSWYATHDTGGAFSGWFWINTLQDLHDLAGGGFYQDYDDWVTYVDAEPAEGQYAGGTVSPGGYSGVCVLHAKDLASIQGIDPDWTQCRGIGGSGHEYGHTHGLPHPPPGPDFGRALMGTGYLIYPNCVLLQSDKDMLNQNPFFTSLPYQSPPARLCPFNLPAPNDKMANT